MELMMSEAILNDKEITKNHITNLLNKLTLAYQSAKEERQEIVNQFPPKEEEFSLLEEIELLTVSIRGYACQIQAQGRIENETKAIEQLQGMRIFKIPVIAQFYFSNKGKYEQMKDYIRMLDYLRLLMLEYLQPKRVN
jgi:hypothetical protein